MVSETGEMAKFQGAVQVVKALIEQGKAYILLPTAMLPEPFERRVAVRILDDEALQSLLSKKELSAEDFRKLLNKEILELIAVCLDERQKRYAEEQVRRWQERKYDNVRIDTETRLLEQKLKHVDEFLGVRLKEAWEFKKHPKTPFFSDFDWDIKVKHFDNESEVKHPVVLATCQITYGTGSNRLLENRDSIEISCTESDIDFLTKVLVAVKEKIQSIRKEGKWE